MISVVFSWIPSWHKALWILKKSISLSLSCYHSWDFWLYDFWKNHDFGSTSVAKSWMMTSLTFYFISLIFVMLWIMILTWLFVSFFLFQWSMAVSHHEIVSFSRYDFWCKFGYITPCIYEIIDFSSTPLHLIVRPSAEFSWPFFTMTGSSYLYLNINVNIVRKLSSPFGHNLNFWKP